ncbi:crinkler family protein [Gigaspora margarita]|nr:crinkler family protein [Gigaspora margarita]
MLWGLIVEMDCSWETFGDVWRRIIHISWVEWIEQCQQAPMILILDDDIQAVLMHFEKLSRVVYKRYQTSILSCLEHMDIIVPIVQEFRLLLRYHYRNAKVF